MPAAVTACEWRGGSRQAAPDSTSRMLTHADLELGKRRLNLLLEGGAGGHKHAAIGRAWRAVSFVPQLEDGMQQDRRFPAQTCSRQSPWRHQGGGQDLQHTGASLGRRNCCMPKLCPLRVSVPDSCAASNSPWMSQAGIAAGREEPYPVPLLPMTRCAAFMAATDSTMLSSVRLNLQPYVKAAPQGDKCTPLSLEARGTGDSHKQPHMRLHAHIYAVCWGSLLDTHASLGVHSCAWACIHLLRCVPCCPVLTAARR